MLKNDAAIYKKIKTNWDNIAKPLDSLGDFETLICKIGAIQGTERPSIDRRCVVVMCADNGVVEEGISQCGPEVTLAVARNMGKRSSSVCKMALKVSCDVRIFDIGINSAESIPGVENIKIAPGTHNFLREYAIDINDTKAAIDAGIDIVKGLKSEGYNLIATGEMGIGNTTTSTALICKVLGMDPEVICGRGAGLDDSGLTRKKQVIEKALEIYKDLSDPVEILSAMGGLDIAGLVGVYIGGALYQIPVVIDGLISATAALIADIIKPGVRDFCIASHSGKENGIKKVLDYLGLVSYVDGNMALGEGTGAVMLIPLIDMILDIYVEGTSFKELEVEKYKRFV